MGFLSVFCILLGVGVVSSFQNQNFTTMWTTSQTTPFDMKKPTDYRYLYNNLANYFLIWFIPICIAIGVFGGAFCLIFFFTSRLFTRNLLIWLVSICIADMMTLLTDALRVQFKIWYRIDFRDSGDFMCATHNYFSNFFFYWSAYMQACMSLQRLYFIMYPLRARVQLTFKRILGAWALVSLLCNLPHLPYLLYWRINPVNKDCEPSDTKYYKITTLCDMIIWGIIPLAAMTMATTFISIKVFNLSVSGFVRSITKRDKDPKHSVTSTPINPRKLINGRPSLSASKDSCLNVDVRGSKDEIQGHSKKIAGGMGQRHGADNASHVTQVLVFSNFFYMITTYPLIIYLMHLNFGLKNQVGITIPQPVHKFIYYKLRSISYLNCAFNWFFYCAVGKVFRRRASKMLKRIFCCQFLKSRQNLRSSHWAGSDTLTAPSHVRDHVHPVGATPRASITLFTPPKGTHAVAGDNISIENLASNTNKK